MHIHYVARFAGLAGVVAGAGLLSAGSAAGTSVIGAGNAAFSNSCSNGGTRAPQAATTNGPGSVTGLIAVVPLSSSTNQCGSLGVGRIPITYELH